MQIHHCAKYESVLAVILYSKFPKNLVLWVYLKDIVILNIEKQTHILSF